MVWLQIERCWFRYEIGISLDTGDIVWVHRLYPCGSKPDNSIFTKGMKRALDPSERVVADNGYFDDKCITLDTIDSPIDSVLHFKLRARRETANKRLKQFSVLKAKFRHDLSYHATTRLEFKYEPLFEVKF